LFPADVLRADVEPGGFGPEARVGSLTQEGDQLGFIQLAQGHATLAAQIFGEPVQGFTLEPQAKFAQRRIERVVQRQHWRRASRRARVVPNHVEQDIPEIWILVVPVRVPVAGAHIYFHIARARRLIADLNHRARKIRSAFGIGEAGVKYPNRLSVGSFEPVPTQALMQPDGLKQTFGRQVIPVAQDIRRTHPRAPESIEAAGSWKHLEIAFAPTMAQSQAGAQEN
jgi:hypothetical protein